jgi:hypothetical protein
MTRQKLKYVYNLLIAAAAAIGFAAGYTLKGKSFQSLSWGQRPARSYEKDFPGARSRYEEIKREFSSGDFVKVDYRSTLALLKQAISRDPGYLPYHTLLAKVYEDSYENLTSGRVTGPAARSLAESLGLDPQLQSASLAEKCKELALAQWQGLSQYPMCSRVEEYGNQWQLIRQQHVNALTREWNLQLTLAGGGIVDLTPAYSIYAITRDHDRYVNNLSSLEKGPTFEEKHISDVIRCPRHPEVAFQFPCLPYLSLEKTRTIREDVDFFCNAMLQDNQHLDLPDFPAKTLHLLCLNVTEQRRIVNSMVRIEFTDGSMKNYPVAVGPWMQSPELLRNVQSRRSLDPVFRDTEVHLCNGSELETMTSPIYMYHVSVNVDPVKIIDKVAFPRHDPSTAGLEDEGMRDIRILAMTLQ